MTFPLARAFPAFATMPWTEVGTWPTAVEPMDALARELGLAAGQLWIKREDQSGGVYGGNKLRSLEPLLGEAQAAGATRIYATGAFGSNQALATVLHAQRLGLEAGALLFPQPHTETALKNLIAILGASRLVRALPHWSWLPFAMGAEKRRATRAGVRSVVLPPGGATPVGTLGYASAALELCEQVAAGACPLPGRIYVGAGSVATSAGLLLGLRLALRTGRISTMPEVVAVRVTPWPVTGAFRIAGLAARAGALVSRQLGSALVGGRLGKAELGATLRVTGAQLGKGYGYATPAGEAASAASARTGGPPLDVCYSAKVMAALMAEARAGGVSGPVLFWSSKSSRPLPPVDEAALAAAPARMQRWIERARRGLAPHVEARQLPPAA